MRLTLRVIALVLLATGSISARAADSTTVAAPAPVLYVFAHEDDEIFVLAKMRTDVRAGREVHAVWITDGGMEGKPEVREQESRAVMALVGVPASRLHFLGFPDHGSIQYLAAIHKRLLALAGRRPFVEITSPAYEGGNIDHDVAAFISAQVAKELSPAPVHYEFPLYNFFDGKRQIGVFLPNAATETRSLPLDAELRTLIQRSLGLYHSQHLLLAVLEVTGHKKALLARGEPIRLQPGYDFLRRPLEEPCGYEISGRHRASFDTWKSEVTSFLGTRLVGAE